MSLSNDHKWKPNFPVVVPLADSGNAFQRRSGNVSENFQVNMDVSFKVSDTVPRASAVYARHLRRHKRKLGIVSRAPRSRAAQSAQRIQERLVAGRWELEKEAERPWLCKEVGHDGACVRKEPLPCSDNPAAILCSVDTRPAPRKRRRRPMISVVLDDIGVNQASSKRAMELRENITLSFLPYAPNLEAQAQAATAAGHELMLHMPMQPYGSGVDPGEFVLRTDMKQEEVKETLELAMARLSGFVGVNNHMGSRFTSEAREGMEAALTAFHERGVFYLDSLTASDSVGPAVAAELGLPYAVRDVFLDAEDDPDFVRKQLLELEHLARRNNHAIAIGHPYDATLDELQRWLPTVKGKGLKLVKLSDAICKEQQQRRQAMAVLASMRSHHERIAGLSTGDELLALEAESADAQSAKELAGETEASTVTGAPHTSPAMDAQQQESPTRTGSAKRKAEPHRSPSWWWPLPALRFRLPTPPPVTLPHPPWPPGAPLLQPLREWADSQEQLRALTSVLLGFQRWGWGERWPGPDFWRRLLPLPSLQKDARLPSPPLNSTGLYQVDLALPETSLRIRVRQQLVNDTEQPPLPLPARPPRVCPAALLSRGAPKNQGCVAQPRRTVEPAPCRRGTAAVAAAAALVSSRLWGGGREYGGRKLQQQQQVGGRINDQRPAHMQTSRQSTASALGTAGVLQESKGTLIAHAEDSTVDKSLEAMLCRPLTGLSMQADSPKSQWKHPEGVSTSETSSRSTVLGDL